MNPTHNVFEQCDSMQQYYCARNKDGGTPAVETGIIGRLLLSNALEELQAGRFKMHFLLRVHRIYRLLLWLICWAQNTEEACYIVKLYLNLNWWSQQEEGMIFRPRKYICRCHSLGFQYNGHTCGMPRLEDKLMLVIFQAFTGRYNNISLIFHPITVYHV